MSNIIILAWGGTTIEGDMGCAAVMTPFFQASQCSLDYRYTINAPLMINFSKKFALFSLVFGQNFSSRDKKF